MLTFPKKEIVLTVALTTLVYLMLTVMALGGLLVWKAQGTTLEYSQGEYNKEKHCWETVYYPWLDAKLIWPWPRRTSGCMPGEPDQGMLDATNILKGTIELTIKGEN